MKDKAQKEPDVWGPCDGGELLLGHQGCLLDMVQFQPARQLRVSPPPPFSFGMQRNRPATDPRDERGGKGGGGGGVLRGEQAEERRRALEHIHRLTLVEQMENGA